MAHMTTVEQMLLNEIWDELRGKLVPRIHPEVARELNKQRVVIETLIRLEYRRCVARYPKNTNGRLEVYEENSLLKAVGLDPDAPLVRQIAEMADRNTAEVDRDLLS